MFDKCIFLLYNIFEIKEDNMQNFILFGILLTLLKHKKVTAKKLAEQFEISTRTVYRYIDELSLSGVPVFSTKGKNGGIEIMNNYVFDKNFFTCEEKDFLCCSLKTTAGNNSAIAKQILTKLM